MTIQNVDSFLAHYGIKGMKWGVIRKEGADGLVIRNKAEQRTHDATKSAHRISLEAKYQAKGATPADAERRANNKIRTQKVLLGIGAVAATAAVGYAGYVHYDKLNRSVDMPAGSVFKNINALGAGQDFNRRLYVTMSEKDGAKYRGLLATQLRRNVDKTTIYESSLETLTRIKAPSQREAFKLYKEFAGKPTMKFGEYKDFNRLLISDQGGKSTAFYDFMTKKGYNSILDINDQVISGYNTRKPLILFNAASTTMETGRRVVSVAESSGLNKKQTTAILGKQVAKYIGIGSALVTANKAVTNNTKKRIVDEYLAEHPNTTKSYTELFNEVKKRNGVFSL